MSYNRVVVGIVSARSLKVLLGAIALRVSMGIACFVMLTELGKKVYGSSDSSPLGVNAPDWGVTLGLLLGKHLYGLFLDFRYANRPWRSLSQWFKAPFGSSFAWSASIVGGYALGISAIPVFRGDLLRLQFFPCFCLTILVALFGQTPVESRLRRIQSGKVRRAELKEVERHMSAEDDQ